MARKKKSTTRKKKSAGRKKARTPAQVAATKRMLAAKARKSPSRGMVVSESTLATLRTPRKKRRKKGNGPKAGTMPGAYAAAARRSGLELPEGFSSSAYNNALAVMQSGGVSPKKTRRKKTTRKKISRRKSATGHSLGQKKNEQRVITASDIISGKSKLGNEVWTCIGPVRRGCGGGARLGRFTSKS